MKRHWITRFVRSTPPDKATGAVMVPVYRASTYHQPDPWNPQKYDYARSGNPTREALEQAMADLEGGARGLAFASGNAAITAACLLFGSGDHLIVTRDCQGGTQRMFREVWARFKLSASFVDTHDLTAVERAILPNTRAILVENFSNPFLAVTDIAPLVKLAHQRGVLVLVDNTFVTPAWQNPLTLGADAVIYSATKLIAGHADVTAGLIVAREAALGDRLYTIQNSTGGILSPDESYQVLRGLQTLPLRAARAAENAEELARWLKKQPEVAQVYYPGLKGHPGHEIAKATMRGFGNMVTLCMREAERVPQWVRALSLIQVGAGFGSTATILSIARLHCHAALTPAERAERGIGDDVVRFSVGLEAVEDLQNDLLQAWRGVDQAR